jgi:hypothetical protein
LAAKATDKGSKDGCHRGERRQPPDAYSEAICEIMPKTSERPSSPLAKVEA